MLKNIMMLILVLISCKEDIEKERDFGIVIFASGSNATITKERKIEPLKVGEIVESGNAIITGDNTTLDVQFGKSVVRILENTTFRVKDIGTYNSFRLEHGKLFAKVNKLNKSDSFNISTPVFVAGVRGTTYSIEINDKEHYATTFKVYDGMISISKEDKNDLFILKGEALKTTNHSIEKTNITYKDELVANNIAIADPNDIDKFIDSKKFDDLLNIIAEVTTSQEKQSVYWILNNNKGKKLRKDFISYYGRIERVMLTDGSIIEGVIIYQDDNFTHIDTLQGKVKMESDKIDEVIYE